MLDTSFSYFPHFAFGCAGSHKKLLPLATCTLDKAKVDTKTAEKEHICSYKLSLGFAMTDAEQVKKNCCTARSRALPNSATV